MSLRVLAICIVGILISACTDSSTGDAAAQVVESYLEAKVSSDVDSITNLICSELESTIDREAASFASVEASIEDMSCSTNDNIVSCSGQIVALYGQENREFPLTSYRVVQEDGEWRWCGEGQ